MFRPVFLRKGSYAQHRGGWHISASIDLQMAAQLALEHEATSCPPSCTCSSDSPCGLSHNKW